MRSSGRCCMLPAEQEDDDDDDGDESFVSQYLLPAHAA